MLSPLPTLLAKAQKGHYAVPAFNVNNLEFIQAIVQAAEEERSPVIIQTSEGAIEYAGMEELGMLVHLAAKRSKVPIAFHLDHGKHEETALAAIKSGFYGSVMFDGSSNPFEENIKKTKKLVAVARGRRVAVEAELGAIAGIEDFVSVEEKDSHLTDPEQAAVFVRQTGCDALAVAIGTKHGAYKFTKAPKLDIKRLEAIRARVSIPLVLHGASGIPSFLKKLCLSYGCAIEEAHGVSDALIKDAIKGGVCKINIDSDLRVAFDAGVRQFLQKHPEDIDPRHILGGGKVILVQAARQKMQLMGSSGKA